MVISTIRIKLPTGKFSDALKIVRPIAVHSRDDPGCISYSVYRDVEEDNVLMIQGVWKTEEDMAAHVRLDDYRNLLLVLEMSLKQPLVRFDTISSSKGIELIEKIRN